MSLASIIVTNVIGLILLGGLFFSSSMTRERRNRADLLLTVLMISVAGACIAEPVSWFVDGHDQWWCFVLAYVSNSYCYIGSVVCSYLWVLYVDQHLNRSHDYRVHCIPAVFVPTVLYVLAVVGNFFGQYLFTIDSHNVYARQPLGYLGYAIMLFSLLYSVLVKRRYDRVYGKTRFFAIGLFLLPISTAAVAQALVYGVSIVWPSVAVGLALIYMAQQNELAYIDGMTGLYNRLYLDATIRSIGTDRGHTAGIMIDLDRFKAINDTYGHRVGDEALRDAASCISEALPPHAVIVRYAGDEFVALTDDTTEEGLGEIERNIQERVDAFNARGSRPYRLSLSMGHDIFHTGEDTPHSFIDRIDKRMYEQKRRHHDAH